MTYDPDLLPELPPPSPPQRPLLSRRALLGGLAGTGAAAATGYGIWNGMRSDPGFVPGGPGVMGAGAMAEEMGEMTGGGGSGAAGITDARYLDVVANPDLGRRVLVLIELSGGNDGLATLAPMRDGAYRRLRPNLAFADEEVSWIDDAYGVNPSLRALNQTGLAFVQGVGTRAPTLSHFESEARWWSGDSDGTAHPATGFLGRLCDELDVGAPITGVSLGSGVTPALISAKAVTLGLPDPGSLWWLTNDEAWYQNLRAGFGAFGGGGRGGDLASASERGLRDALAFAEVLGRLTEAQPENYPGSELSNQLALTAKLIEANVGVRVFHVKTGGFDTHDDQRGTHDGLMADLNDSLVAFLNDVNDRGWLDSVLVATTSEFGRRPAENNGGTDHGTASVALCAGPVTPGRHGEYPSLTALDENDDLVATVDMDQYYGTLAGTWFGIDPGLVLPNGAVPLEGVIRT